VVVLHVGPLLQKQIIKVDKHLLYFTTSLYFKTVTKPIRIGLYVGMLELRGGFTH
jgi:hypothetical protein